VTLGRMHVVGVYQREVRMVRRPTVTRAYVVLEYAGEPLGVLAINDRVFAMLRADHVPVLPERPRRRK
jgi:hypothetical protein